MTFCDIIISILSPKGIPQLSTFHCQLSTGAKRKQQFPLVQINRQGVMTMEELLDILEALWPDVDFGREERLVEDGILDSFDIVSIVAELDGALGVRIGAEELVPENFNSARALWAMVQRHRG